MKFWVITDTHFGHEKIKDYCDRPLGCEVMILENLKTTVKPDDVLIHLGDVAWYRDAYWNGILSDYAVCKKWLVRGNHDKKSSAWYLRHGWDCAVDRISLKMYGKDIAFTHKPIADDGYDVNTHGHLHNKSFRHHEEEMLNIKNDKQVLVAMEHDYIPVDLKSLVGLR